MNSPTQKPVLLHYAAGAALAAFFLNLLLRGLFRLPGMPATLMVAGLVALGTSLVFARHCQRLAEPGERFRLVLLYAGIMGSLYALLFALMLFRDEPGPMGQLLFLLHYLSYPLALWFCFSPAWLRRFLPDRH